MSPTRRIAICLSLCAVVVCIVSPKVRYVLTQACFQGELLARRTPIDQAVKNGDIPERHLVKVEIIHNVKRFGATIGLKATDNYDTIAVGWNRTIWNLSASRPDRFAPKRWWFPITGSVPYLGYFREHDARETEQNLRRRGYDVYVRTAGAYSTLGWFRDPVLPQMLEWSEYALASTLLHELAHATLWIPGSIKFNESFANVVGERAGLQYLEHTYGVESKELREAVELLEDRARYRALLHELYKNLDTLYQRSDLTPAEVQNRKREILATLPQRVATAGFHQPKRYLRAAAPQNWNNARLMQFKTYNSSGDWFRAVADHCQDDLNCFMSTIESLTRDQADPFAALEAFALPLINSKENKSFH